ERKVEREKEDKEWKEREAKHKQRIDTLNARLTAESGHTATFREKSMHLAENSKAKDAEIIALREELVKASDAMDRLESEKQEQKDTLSEMLTEQTNIAQTERIRAKDVEDRFREDIEELQFKLRSERQEKEKMEQMMRVRESDFTSEHARLSASLEEAKKRLESQMSSFSETQDEKDQTIHLQKKDLARVTRDCAKLKDKVSKHRREVDEEKEKCLMLTEDLEKYKALYSATEEQKSKLSQELTHARSQITSLENDCEEIEEDKRHEISVLKTNFEVHLTSLDEQKKTLTEHVSNLSEQLDSLRHTSQRQVKALEGELDMRDETIEKLKADISNLHTTRRELERSKKAAQDSLEAEKESMEKHQRDLLTSSERLRAQLDQYKVKFADSEEKSVKEVNALQMTIDGISREKEELVTSKNEEIDLLKVELGDVTSELKAKDEQIVSLEDDLSKQRLALQLSSQEKRRLEEKLTSCQHSFSVKEDDLSAELESLGDKIARLEEECQRSAVTITSLNNKLGTSEESLSTTAERLSQTEDTLDRLRRSLRGEQAQFKEKLVSLEGQNEDLRQRLDKETAEVARLSKEVANHVRERTVLDEERKTADRAHGEELKALQIHNTELEGQYMQLQKICTEAGSKYDSLVAELDKRAEIIDTLKRQQQTDLSDRKEKERALALRIADLTNSFEEAKERKEDEQTLRKKEGEKASVQIAKIGAELSDYKKRVSSLESVKREMQATIREKEGELSALFDTRSALERKIETLEAKVQSLDTQLTDAQIICSRARGSREEAMLSLKRQKEEYERMVQKMTNQLEIEKETIIYCNNMIKKERSMAYNLRKENKSLEELNTKLQRIIDKQTEEQQKMLTVSSVYGSSSSSSSSSGIYSSSSASASIVESLRQKYQAKLESVIVNLNHVVAENKVLLEQVATLRATVDGQQSDIIKKLDALSVANMSEVKHVLKSEEEKHDSHAQLRESLAEMQVLRSKLKQTEEELIALKVAHSKEGVDSGDKTRGQGFDYSGSLSSSLSPS
ncbi:hypothetical protein ADUPG1_010581, partial [Aduncisulcus paluster]